MSHGRVLLKRMCGNAVPWFRLVDDADIGPLSPKALQQERLELPRLASRRRAAAAWQNMR